MLQKSTTFFIDFDAVVKWTKTAKDEARGHLLMLSSEVDKAMSVASLIDGTAVDFLFGVKAAERRPGVRFRPNDVKKYLSTLDDEGQEAFAKFYYVVFAAVVRYHSQMEHVCACLRSSWLQQDLRNEVEEAFRHLLGVVTERNIVEDD
mmetsp:Transcript_20098/g.44680  ORF Transcript_20098/g.44680 Transcript_20098/m.44680 type:complete len:148 (-) Transcript_20098:225-668(-)